MIADRYKIVDHQFRSKILIELAKKGKKIDNKELNHYHNEVFYGRQN